jgi:hypothetical protein
MAGVRHLPIFAWPNVTGFARARQERAARKAVMLLTRLLMLCGFVFADSRVRRISANSGNYASCAFGRVGVDSFAPSAQS